MKIWKLKNRTSFKHYFPEDVNKAFPLVLELDKNLDGSIWMWVDETTILLELHGKYTFMKHDDDWLEPTKEEKRLFRSYKNAIRLMNR